MNPELETVVLDGDRSIRSLHYRCSAFQEDHSWHYHPECEVSFIVTGSGTRFVGDSVEPFCANDLVFIGPNIPHCWVSDEAEKQNEMIVLQFSPGCLGDRFLDTPEAQGFKTLLTKAQRGVQVLGEDRFQIRKELENIAESKGLRRLSHFILLLDQLCHAQQVTLLASEFYMADNSEFNAGRLGKIMEYVKQHIADDIKQTDVADMVCMTPQSFSRFFRATTGRTFVSFVNIVRITEASRQLVNTDKDIGDIAFDCGYSNLSNFNRRFSEIKACTPSEYRKVHQSLN